MATKRRKTHRRRAVARAAVNPRRHHRRRRRNPFVAHRRRRSAAAANPRRQHHRRRNPSAMKIGEVIKDMLYGAGGAIGTRVISGAVQGLVPASFSASPLAVPVVQAGVAVTAIRWLGKKFLGQRQGDILMLGGLISAGLALADAYLPGIQGSLTNVLRTPITAFTPQTALPSPAQIAAGTQLGDVEDVPNSFFSGFADVEDVQGLGI